MSDPVKLLFLITGEIVWLFIALGVGVCVGAFFWMVYSWHWGSQAKKLRDEGVQSEKKSEKKDRLSEDALQSRVQSSKKRGFRAGGESV